MALPTTVADGQAGHATLHNDTNAAVNPLIYDTGWRNITIAGDITGTLRLRRLGRTVILQAVDLAVSGASDGEVLTTLPTGFRPPSGQVLTRQYLQANAFHLLGIEPTGVINVWGSPANGVISVSQEFTTDDAEPATLPGTAA